MPAEYATIAKVLGQAGLLVSKYAPDLLRSYQYLVPTKEEDLIQRLARWMDALDVLKAHPVDEQPQAMLKSLDALNRQMLDVIAHSQDERMRILVEAMRDIVRAFTYRWHRVFTLEVHVSALEIRTEMAGACWCEPERNFVVDTTAILDLMFEDDPAGWEPQVREQAYQLVHNHCDYLQKLTAGPSEAPTGGGEPPESLMREDLLDMRRKLALLFEAVDLITSANFHSPQIIYDT